MCLRIPKSKILYLPEPENSFEYTNRLNRAYTKYAKAYDIAVSMLPVWKTWLKRAIPYIEGKRILEGSFGTGYLLMQYASHYETYGIDYNARMVEISKDNLSKKGILQQFYFEFVDKEIGGWGSVHLYISEKKTV